MSIIFTPDAVTLSHMVDRLAILKATIATLKTEEEEIKLGLVATGLPIIESSLHRCSVGHQNGRTVIDWKTIAEKLSPSRQLVTAHTTQGEPFAVVRVSARKS
jgi:hypothetical protein